MKQSRILALLGREVEGKIANVDMGPVPRRNEKLKRLMILAAMLALGLVTAVPALAQVSFEV